MGQIVRPEMWDVRLVEKIESSIGKPFKWGDFDCCLFAAECYDAMYGTKLAERYRGHYDDALSALKYLRSKGYYNLHDAAVGETGGVDQKSELAQRGDIICLPMSERHMVGALGIVVDHRAAFSGEYGLVFIEISSLESGTTSVKV